MQFEQSIEEMVEHGWDEEVARKALLMQWQKDIDGRGGSRKDQKQFEKTVKVPHDAHIFSVLFCCFLPQKAISHMTSPVSVQPVHG